MLFLCNFSGAILERGIEQGIEFGKIQLLSVLVEGGKLSLKEAAECVGLSPEAFGKKIKEERL